MTDQRHAEATSTEGPDDVAAGAARSAMSSDVAVDGTGFLCQQLMELQAQRVRMMRQEYRARNDAISYVRRILGWQWNQADATRQQLNDRARTIVSELWSGNTPDESEKVLGIVSPYVVGVAYHPWHHYSDSRKQHERKMREIARQLPIAPWVKSVDGVTFDTIGVMIGEIGDPMRFRHWRCVAKRMGLMPYKGRMPSAWRRKGGLTEDEWSYIGYCPRRRSVMYNWAASQIRVRSSWRTAIYEPWKAWELQRTDDNAPQSQGHADKRARVAMERTLIRRLVEQWSEAVGTET